MVQFKYGLAKGIFVVGNHLLHPRNTISKAYFHQTPNRSIIHAGKPQQELKV